MRKTTGAVSQELLKKEHTNTHTAADQGASHLAEYDKNVHEAIMAGCKQFKGDFYVVVLVKRERLMRNVLRLYYFPRESCPTPQHEQMVYRYHRKTGHVEELWVIPSLEACVILYNEASYAHPEEKQLLQYVLDFEDGTLLDKAKKLNGEYNKSM